MRILALFAGTVMLGIATAAQAAIITTPTQAVTFELLPTDWDQSGRFQLFDASLGTLLSVRLSASFTETSTVTISNSPKASRVSTGNASTASVLQLSSDVSSVTQAIQSALGGGTPDTLNLLGAKFFYSRLPAGASASGPSSGSVATGVVIDSNAADLTSFTAVGPVLATIFASTSTLTNVSNTGGNASANVTTLANGNFTVAYTYQQPVPEPNSVMLLGVGLAGAGIIRRRVR